MISIKSITKAVQYLVDQVRLGRFVPILEADVVGFMYHTVIRKRICPSDTIHLDTRIAFGPTGNKVDLAVGGVKYPSIGPSPAIEANMIIECKVFVSGFKRHQCGRRFASLQKRDLPKFHQFAKSKRSCRLILFLFDEVGYFEGEYMGQSLEKLLITERNKLCPTAKILLAQKQSSDGEWRVKRF